MHEWDTCHSIKSGLRRMICYAVLALPPLELPAKLPILGTATISVPDLTCTAITFGSLNSSTVDHVGIDRTLSISLDDANLQCRTDRLAVSGVFPCKAKACVGAALITVTSASLRVSVDVHRSIRDDGLPTALSLSLLDAKIGSLGLALSGGLLFINWLHDILAALLVQELPLLVRQMVEPLLSPHGLLNTLLFNATEWALPLLQLPPSPLPEPLPTIYPEAIDWNASALMSSLSVAIDRVLGADGVAWLVHRLVGADGVIRLLSHPMELPLPLNLSLANSTFALRVEMSQLNLSGVDELVAPWAPLEAVSARSLQSQLQAKSLGLASTLRVHARRTDSSTETPPDLPEDVLLASLTLHVTANGPSASARVYAPVNGSAHLGCLLPSLLPGAGLLATDLQVGFGSYTPG